MKNLHSIPKEKKAIELEPWMKIAIATFYKGVGGRYALRVDANKNFSYQNLNTGNIVQFTRRDLQMWLTGEYTEHDFDWSMVKIV